MKIKSLKHFLEVFPDNQAVLDYLEAKRWPKDFKCIFCQSKFYKTASLVQPYKCKGCNRRFSIKTGTIMEGSKLSTWQWLMAIYQISINKKGLSSALLATLIGTTQPTAWWLAQKIREAFTQPREQ